MSGHSKWSQIKHKKAATDAQKSKIFSKIARQIFVAVRDKGPDPETNIVLRAAIDKAKEANMPSDNIDRAIKKASGEGENSFEEALFEAYAPGGVAILIKVITDNKNRSSQEIKHFLSQNESKLANPGSALFLFRQEGGEWKPTTNVSTDEKTKEKIYRLLEGLNERDDVTDLYFNLEENSGV